MDRAFLHYLLKKIRTLIRLAFQLKSDERKPILGILRDIEETVTSKLEE